MQRSWVARQAHHHKNHVSPSVLPRNVYPPRHLRVRVLPPGLVFASPRSCCGLSARIHIRAFLLPSFYIGSSTARLYCTPSSTDSAIQSNISNQSSVAVISLKDSEWYAILKMNVLISARRREKKFWSLIEVYGRSKYAPEYTEYKNISRTRDTWILCQVFLHGAPVTTVSQSTDQCGAEQQSG